MSDQQPIKTPSVVIDGTVQEIINHRIRIGLSPWATLEQKALAMEAALSAVNAENLLLRQKCFADDCDSVVASCNCLTKSPEVQHHKKGCKYRLIMERVTSNAEVERLRSLLPESYYSDRATFERFEFMVKAWKKLVPLCEKLDEQNNALLANSKALAEALLSEGDFFALLPNSQKAIAAHENLMEQFK